MKIIMAKLHGRVIIVVFVRSGLALPVKVKFSNDGSEKLMESVCNPSTIFFFRVLSLEYLSVV